MFKFTDLSKNEEFNIEEYRLSTQEFMEKRRTSKRPYVFDLRSAELYEAEKIPGSHNLPIEHFENSIYQMPFAGDILLYGSEDGEVLTAAEILYDNGFDTFSFTESFESFFNSLDDSFVKVNAAAKQKINQKLKSEESLSGVQISVEPTSPLKTNYGVEFVESPKEGSIKVDVSGIAVFVERSVVPYLEGTVIEVNEQGDLEAINPQLSISKLSGSLEEQIQIMLDEQVNPMLASHGGNVKLEGLQNGAAYVRFGGGCQGCSQIDATLKQGVEVMLKEAIPELSGVFDVTDHEQGDTPFYAG